MEIIELIFLGGLVGFISSFFGVGGGSLVVPILYSLHPQISAEVAIGASLGTIFITASINVFKFQRKGLLPPFKLLISFILMCVVGGLIGAQVLDLISTAEAKKIMGGILLIMAIKLFIIKNKDTNIKEFKAKFIPFAITGILGAFISSITGLGGGIIFTPALINILKVPMPMVSPISNVGMAVATLMGTIPHLFSKANFAFESTWINYFFIGKINFFLIIVMSIGAAFTSSIGVKYNSLVKPLTKKILLALLLVLFSLKLLL